MRLLLASALLLAACKCPCPCPPDMGRDMSAPRDLARPADLSSSPDLARPPDLSCIKCDAVVNPCPALGLDCDPVARCCAARPADLSAGMSCQPRLASCVAPLRCCPGLDCVGGLCALVARDL